jgi:hypothetical protein
MNKRERRAVVMAERYAKVDQREQQPVDSQPKFIDYFCSLDNPLARVFEQIYKDAFASGDVGDAIDFIVNWKKENPEVLKELRVLMDQAFEDYAEMRNDKT